MISTGLPRIFGVGGGVVGLKKVPELFQQGITTLGGPLFHHFDGLSGHFLLRGQLPRVDSGVLLGDDVRDIDAEPPARRGKATSRTSRRRAACSFISHEFPKDCDQ